MGIYRTSWRRVVCAFAVVGTTAKCSGTWSPRMTKARCTQAAAAAAAKVARVWLASTKPGSRAPAVCSRRCVRCCAQVAAVSGAPMVVSRAVMASRSRTVTAQQTCRPLTHLAMGSDTCNLTRPGMSLV